MALQDKVQKLKLQKYISHMTQKSVVEIYLFFSTHIWKSLLQEKNHCPNFNESEMIFSFYCHTIFKFKKKE